MAVDEPPWTLTPVNDGPSGERPGHVPDFETDRYPTGDARNASKATQGTERVRGRNRCVSAVDGAAFLVSTDDLHPPECSNGDAGFPISHS